jgi:hypothetical protein
MIIGLTGDIGSGKDTFADYLVKKYDYIKYSMSDPLKLACANLFEIDINYFHDRILKESIISDKINYTPRNIMRIVGTEVTRDHFPNHFSKIMDIKISNLMITNPKCNIVIPDIRFEDEYDIIKKHNGVIINIVNLNLNLNLNLHSSDLQKIKYDYKVLNDKTNNYYNEIEKLSHLF